MKNTKPTIVLPVSETSLELYKFSPNPNGNTLVRVLDNDFKVVREFRSSGYSSAIIGDWSH